MWKNTLPLGSRNFPLTEEELIPGLIPFLVAAPNKESKTNSTNEWRKGSLDRALNWTFVLLYMVWFDLKLGFRRRSYRYYHVDIKIRSTSSRWSYNYLGSVQKRSYNNRYNSSLDLHKFSNFSCDIINFIFLLQLHPSISLYTYGMSIV